MAPRLSHSPQLRTLARDLGLRPSDDVVRDILRYCDRRIRKLLSDFTDEHNPASILDWLASKLGTRFEMVRSEAEVISLQEKYVGLGEVGFVDFDNKLTSVVLGFRVRRQKQQPFECPFFSLIDGGGSRASALYFTKWHEFAPLLTMTNKLRFFFRQTRCSSKRKEPKEALMDV